MSQYAFIPTGEQVVQTKQLSRKQSTIQTHNAVSITATTVTANANWIPCDGYDKIGVSLLNDASTSSSVSIFWSYDNATTHGQDKDFIPAGTINTVSGVVDVKAPFFKVAVNNRDTTTHVMSAWAYLKA